MEEAQTENSPTEPPVENGQAQPSDIVAFQQPQDVADIDKSKLQFMRVLSLSQEEAAAQDVVEV